MRARTMGLSGLAAAALLLAGCGSTVQGTARAADDAGPATSASPAAPPGTAPSTATSPGSAPEYLAELGPAPESRPADLPLDSVDLCGLVTPELQQELGVSGPGEPDVQECGYPLGEDSSFDVRVLDRSAASFLGNDEVAGFPVAVGGYLAVVGWNLPDEGRFCYVNLDTTDSSNLEIVVSGRPGIGTDTLCPVALTVASSTLEQLQAR